jgi:uncharacterized protein (DUF1499 family)
VEETKWSSKLFIFSAGICLFLLIAGPLGYKFEVSGLGPSLVTVLIAVVGAVIVFVGSLIMLFIANKNGLIQDRNLLLVAIAICVIPMITIGPQMVKGTSVPPIHDVSTDTKEPPKFVEVVALREGAPNGLEYEFEGSAEKLAEMQMAAYPELKTLQSELSVADAVDRSASVLASQGLEIVSTDQANGIVEATATTFWFGFKDDVIVRVKKSNTGSVIDVRSVSRVGQSDIGVNAARIMKFIDSF